MRRFWLAVAVMLLCGVFVANWAPVMAQDDAAGDAGAAAAAEPAGGSATPAPAAPVTTQRVSVLGLIVKYSGPVGWLIIMMSFVAIYMIARFGYYLRRSETTPPELVMALEDDLDAYRVREAVEKCNISDCVLSRVIKAGLVQIRNGYEGMVESMQEEGEAESVRLQQQVGWLSIIGAIAPMLGLTGTVLGMMGAFGQIAQQDIQPAPKELAGDIQLALVTTCEGLIVAVPVLLAYAAFRNKVTMTMLEIGVIGGALIERFKGIDITPSMIAGVAEAAEAGGPMMGAAPEAEEGEIPPEEMLDDEEGAPPPPPV